MSLPRAINWLPRIVMPLERCGVPGGLGLGRYNYPSARRALGNHAHENTLEICFLVKGRQSYELGGRLYRMQGGDVFFALPGEWHSTGGFPEEKGILYWLTVPVPRDRRGLLGLPAEQSEALLDALLTLNPRLFRGEWEMAGHLDAITRLYHQPPSPLNAFAITNRLGAFLWLVVQCGRASCTKSPSRSWLLSSLQRYIAEHLDEPLGVPQLAMQAGLSTSRFKAWFKEETGVPPGEYVMRARIEEAQRRLEQGAESVTEVAFDLGFSSSQYFATVFKRITGRTPTARRSPPGRQKK